MHWEKLPNKELCYSVALSHRGTVILGLFHGMIAEYDPSTGITKDVLFLGHGHICHINTSSFPYHVVADTNGYVAIYTEDVHRHEIGSFEVKALPIALAVNQGKVVVGTVQMRVVCHELGVGVMYSIRMPCSIVSVALSYRDSVAVLGTDGKLYQVVEDDLRECWTSPQDDLTFVTYYGTRLLAGTSQGDVLSLSFRENCEKPTVSSNQLLGQRLEGGWVCDMLFPARGNLSSGAEEALPPPWWLFHVGRGVLYGGSSSSHPIRLVPLPEGLTTDSLESVHAASWKTTAKVVISAGADVWLSCSIF